MITILGTGQVGRALLDQLQMIHPEREILLVNKGGKAAFDLPKGTSIIGIDATNPEHLTGVFQKSELVFSCTDVPYPLWNDFYPSLSHAMVEGLKQSDTKLVFADNLYSYGNLKGQAIHEELSHLAQTKKGKIRAALIHHFTQHQVNDRVAIIKSSDFIGPRIEKGVFGLDFLERIYSRKVVNLPGKTQLPHHFTFIEDFARAMIMVAFDAGAYGQIWHVPNAPALSQREWIELFELHTGLKIKYRSIPKIAITLLGMFNPFVKELNELSYQFEYPYLVSSSKFINHFGDISTPADTVVRKTIEWFNLYTKSPKHESSIQP